MYRKIMNILADIFVAIIIIAATFENHWNFIGFVLIGLCIAIVFCQFMILKSKWKIKKLDNIIKDIDNKIDNYKTE